MRKSLLIALLVAVLAVAGCGGSDEEESATPAEASAQIDDIEVLLDRAVDEYRAGDADVAEETVGDAYLEHFEEVEAPLGEIDHDFMEELEERLSTEIRDDIKDGKPVNEVAALVEKTKADLARAKAMLEEEAA